MKSGSPVLGGTDAIAIPRMLSYQGKLLDNVGNPVIDTTYSVLFRLYTVPSGGSSFWSETQTVRTKAGLFAVLLGSVTPISTLPDAGALYLSMKVGADPEMTPRLRIVSSAYAGAAAPVGTAAGDLAGVYPNPTLAQKGATSGQVLKWSGSAWLPRNDSVGQPGGSETVTSVAQSTGIVCTPNPITASGTVAFDATYGDGRYVNVSGDSVTGALAVQGELRAYSRARFGANCALGGVNALAAGDSCVASANRAAALRAVPVGGCGQSSGATWPG